MKRPPPALSRRAATPAVAKTNSTTLRIVTELQTDVNSSPLSRFSLRNSASTRPKTTPRKSRRQSHGSAWHWAQTDSWYYTLPGTKKRCALFAEDGKRIKGLENKKEAQLALARIKLGQGWAPDAALETAETWIVARVCSEYIQYCQRGVKASTISKGHLEGTVSRLNNFCKYCGALPVAQVKKGHLKAWLESHAGWKSPATTRCAIAIVLAAFNYAAENHDIPNPLKGYKKLQATPRLQSLNAKDEKALYKAAAPAFKDFLFAALHTGLRPYCELAKLTAENVEETPRGMMWRVYSSKTKKTRKIPVRPEVATLTRTLLKTAPRGSGVTLFRSPTGRAWSKVNGVNYFIQARLKLGWQKDSLKSKFSSYSCRHTFAHRMLSGYWNNGVGCTVETLAELICDTPKVAFDHYGKEWGQHYQDTLWAAIGG